MRLGKSWDNPELPHVKQTVQEALNLLRSGQEAEPVRCFFKVWSGDPGLNPFLESANDILIEWSNWDEFDSHAIGHTDWFWGGRDVIFIDTMFPGGYQGDFDSMYSVSQVARTIAHETVHRIFHEWMEGPPDYAEDLIAFGGTPFHSGKCCVELTLSLWFKIKFYDGTMVSH
jgi:hypothetical protein